MPPGSDGERSGVGLPFDMGRMRQAMAEQGIEFSAGFIADYSVVLEGGVDDGSDAFRHLTTVGVTLDTQRLFDHPGGTVYADFVTQNGRDGSEEVGDFQAFSNLDTDDFTTIYEAWYEQELLDGRVRIKLGKMDANNEFAFIENGGEFINSSPGFSPTILAFPSYPDSAIGANVFVYEDLDDRSVFYFGIGIFDGALQEGFATGQRGFSTVFGEPSDFFLIGEAGVEHENALGPGRIGVGVWHHSGTFDRFDVGTESGTTGGYVVVDQTLFRANPEDPEDERGIGLFAQYGWADDAVSEVDHHAGLGVQWTGPLAERPDDVLGLMVSPVFFTDEAGAGFTEESEWAFEAFVKLQVTPWLSVKPDIQLILNPGGDEDIDDAWVGTMRFEATY